MVFSKASCGFYRRGLYEVVRKFPFKECIPKTNVLNDEELRFNFFKGPSPLDDESNVIIPIPSEKKDVTDEAFIIGIMNKKVKVCSKDTEFEYIVNSSRLKSCIKKGTLCMTFRLLYCQNEYENDYYIPPKSKEIKVPLIDVYFPSSVDNLTRETYLKCSTKISMQGTNQTVKTYTVCSDSLELLRSAMSTDA